MWALYCLIKFYNVTHHRLQAIKPLSKFISFKAIVFATWWQGVGIALICDFDILPKQGKVQNGIQDFLICIEPSQQLPKAVNCCLPKVDNGGLLYDLALFPLEENPFAAIASVQVVKDVASIISQAMEPVEKCVTKIQESLNHISLRSPTVL
ncbi:protein LAZ1 homolog 2-like [Curcuma longa]|uniref:protein LAZ1 homolog 2-like n=1 Tax=Curcuma longa TaxID=136217 RepID=UPI003D9E4EC2